MVKLAMEDFATKASKLDEIDACGINRNFRHYASLMDQRMHHMHSFVIARFEIMHKIVKLSTRQWSNFMTSNWRWMGNCVLEDGLPHSYESLNPLALTILAKSVFRAQQSRSYYLMCAQKEDLWDSKNAFNNKVSKFIVEENFKTGSMKELERRVVQRVKDWVLARRPRQITDQAWRLFAKQNIHQSKTFINFETSRLVSPHLQHKNPFVSQAQTPGQVKQDWLDPLNEESQRLRSKRDGLKYKSQSVMLPGDRRSGNSSKQHQPQRGIHNAMIPEDEEANEQDG